MNGPHAYHTCAGRNLQHVVHHGSHMDFLPESEEYRASSAIEASMQQMESIDVMAVSQVEDVEEESLENIPVSHSVSTCVVVEEVLEPLYHATAGGVRGSFGQGYESLPMSNEYSTSEAVGASFHSAGLGDAWSVSDAHTHVLLNDCVPNHADADHVGDHVGDHVHPLLPSAHLGPRDADAPLPHHHHHYLLQESDHLPSSFHNATTSTFSTFSSHHPASPSLLPSLEHHDHRHHNDLENIENHPGSHSSEAVLPRSVQLKDVSLNPLLEGSEASNHSDVLSSHSSTTSTTRLTASDWDDSSQSSFPHPHPCDSYELPPLPPYAHSGALRSFDAAIASTTLHNDQEESIKTTPLHSLVTVPSAHHSLLNSSKSHHNTLMANHTPGSAFPKPQTPLPPDASLSPNAALLPYNSGPDLLTRMELRSAASTPRKYKRAAAIRKKRKSGPKTPETPKQPSVAKSPKTISRSTSPLSAVQSAVSSPRSSSASSSTVSTPSDASLASPSAVSPSSPLPTTIVTLDGFTHEISLKQHSQIMKRLQASNRPKCQQPANYAPSPSRVDAASKRTRNAGKFGQEAQKR